jgi:hypothetical protein
MQTASIKFERSTFLLLDKEVQPRTGTAVACSGLPSDVNGSSLIAPQELSVRTWRHSRFLFLPPASRNKGHYYACWAHSLRTAETGHVEFTPRFIDHCIPNCETDRKVKLLLYLIKQQAMKTNGRMEVFIHSSIALQPFIGPWPLLQFRNLFYTDGTLDE